jgi:hypothetical protein
MFPDTFALRRDARPAGRPALDRVPAEAERLRGERLLLDLQERIAQRLVVLAA